MAVRRAGAPARLPDGCGLLMARAASLPQGQVVRLAASGSQGIVGPLIGTGGQGNVHVCDVGGRRLALKWYHDHVLRQDASLRQRIGRLVSLGAPDARYLWPLDRADIPGAPGFGYVMPLMSGDRRPLRDILAAPPHRLAMTMEARATACMEVADSFGRLHALGLCYQDVNFGAFFVDPLRGSVLICDGDNITTDGEVGGVYGTRKFMAPEVIRREAFPSLKTDLFSMAVLFFYLLCNWHPLDGRREVEARTLDAELEARLYGSAPLFIFDETDAANGPVAGFHDWIVARWRMLPRDLRDLFTRSFTQGLADVGRRIVETAWLRALSRLRDAVVRCRACGFELCLEAGPPASLAPCTACGAAVPLPTRMVLPQQIIAVAPGCELHRHHVEPGAPILIDGPVGRIEQHPTRPEILGLVNLTAAAWTGQLRDGRSLGVPPGRTVRVVDGLALDFGRRRGLFVEGDVAA